jgi:hypothetical protein
VLQNILVSILSGYTRLRQFNIPCQHKHHA